ncbi:AAA family ATPase, partial [Novosphingobium sp. Rr 2-17]|uniref:AAA family ATPase n=1 Tax=Novosphingobium sp. Rr 2-17 TaxID=555793 RepID=UPI00178C6906
MKSAVDRVDGTSTSISDGEFLEIYGRPPWEQMNENLSDFGLPYKFSAPPTTLDNFTVMLVRIPTGERVHLSDISSGEKVLLTLAVSSFNYDQQIVKISRPSLLLLDEMDASLHPEMVRAVSTR